jgi:hypothetical protein
MMIFNATSAPANGTVTPAQCFPVASNAGLGEANSPIPAFYSTGIVVVSSSGANCFTLTATNAGFISGQVQ